MAVKRIVPKRLIKISVATENDAVSNSYLEKVLEERIYVGPEDPLNSYVTVLNGSIWRDTTTNPDTWKMLINDIWINMLVTNTEHGLMSNLQSKKLNESTSVPTNYALVEYDEFSGLNATSFNSVSSKRFKTNISPIRLATETIKQLEGVNFTWKKDGTPDIGMIAEEVFEIVPEVVDVKNGIIEGIAYDRLVAVLIEGFKEQQEKIDKILNHLGLENE